MTNILSQSPTEIAIKRLRDIEPDDGYILAFSGGKDSIVIKRLADLAGVKYTAYYSVTTIDPPELVWFIRKHHKDVHFSRPKKTFLQMLVKKKMPPYRHTRWCCDKLKEGLDKRLGISCTIITGIRREESSRRAQRLVYEPKKVGAVKSRPVWFLNPIIDWDSEEVWTFVRREKLPYCSLYDEGFKRLGCIMCPMSNNQNREAERWPRYRELFEKAFIKVFNAKVAEGHKDFTSGRWRDGKHYFEWWLDYRQKAYKKEQVTMDIW